MFLIFSIFNSGFSFLELSLSLGSQVYLPYKKSSNSVGGASGVHVESYVVDSALLKIDALRNISNWI